MAIDNTSGSNPYEKLGLTQNQPKANEGKPTDPQNLGQDQFLELMLAQLKHQDPLKPTENGEFLSQMAQFSQAQGMEELTQSFADLKESMTSNQALQASSMIGRTVLAPNSSGFFDGQNTMGGAFELPSSASSVTVGIYNQNGQMIKELPMGQMAGGKHYFAWDGTDAAGNTVAPGTYDVQVDATIGDETKAVQTNVAAKVESVSLGKNGQDISLNLAGMGSVDFSQVREIM